MSEPNEFLFKEWSEAARKFDYFVAGFLGALAAYFIQNLEAFSFGWNGRTVEFAGVVCLLMSLYVALIRIERHVTIARVNYDLHTRQKCLKPLVDHQPLQPVFDPDTGRQCSEDEIKQSIADLMVSMAERENGREKLATQFRAAYSWRNRLLIAGMGIVLISKFLNRQ